MYVQTTHVRTYVNLLPPVTYYSLLMTTRELSPLIRSPEDENDINQDGAGRPRKVVREQNNKRHNYTTVCIYLTRVALSNRTSAYYR